MNSKKGHFIVIEGLEGAGKSTALDRIKTTLMGYGLEVLVTREPGGTSLGEAVRGLIKKTIPNEPLDARAELLLFYAARVQLVEHVIKPALARGQWVLADRFELSTFAYQGAGRGLDRSMIAQLSKFCLHGLQPHLTFFLDITPEQGFQRIRARGHLDRIEQEPLDFFKAVHASYHEQIRGMSHVVTVDASQPLVEVSASIQSALEAYLHHAI